MARKNRRGSGGNKSAAAGAAAGDPGQQQRLLKPERLLQPAPGPPKVPPQPSPPAYYGDYYHGPPLGPPVDANGIVVGQWAVGLCACWDHCVPNCLMVCCLPYVSLAQISSRLGIARFGNALGFFLALWLVVSVCSVAIDAVAEGELSAVLDGRVGELDWLLNRTDGAQQQRKALEPGQVVAMYALQLLQSAASVALFLSTWQLRANVRERFRIPGGCVDDCCSVFWLSCCVVAQMATHIRSYRPGMCDFGPVDTLPPYDYDHKASGADGGASDAKEPSGAYQRYEAEQDEEKEDEGEDEDEDEEMKSRLRAVDKPSMRYM